MLVQMPRLRESAFAALRLLEICPLMPADAFVPIVGLKSWTAGYQQLARLRRAGLVEVCRVDLSYLLGERRLGLWKTTEAGTRVLGIAGVLPVAADLALLPYGPPARRKRRGRPTETELAPLVAAYRLLATLVTEGATAGQVGEVGAWEQPWIRSAWSPLQAKFVRTRLPAAAVLVRSTATGGSTKGSASATGMLLIPDLGTAPILRYREVIRRLVAMRAANRDSAFIDYEPELVIATPDPDGRGSRADAWRELLYRLTRRRGEPALRARIVGWECVAAVVGRLRVPGLVADLTVPAGRNSARSLLVRRWRAPVRGAEQILQVVGRHPFLTLEQRCDLLGLTSKRLSNLEKQLVERGWLRCMPSEELSEDAIGLSGTERSALRFVELTPAGRRQLASWLGLDTPMASHYHGLIDTGPGQATRRARLLRTLPHTLGVNAVFVAFALAAESSARQGGADELVEWRSAAACERRRCKPDGYGCYRRDGVAYGFLLEYDRGTEPGRRYAAKFGAYYRYRDSGEAARDFEGFPSLLFVTTDPLAEQRIAEQAYRAWFTRGTEPLPILITTTERIVAQREGILGPIWRTPAATRSSDGRDRNYWLTGGPARALIGAGRGPLAMPRMAWPTASQVRSGARMS